MRHETDTTRAGIQDAQAMTAIARFELRYRPLCEIGRGFVFPCDAHGRVVLDQLSERARSNYFHARAVVGRDLGWPVVQRQA